MKQLTMIMDLPEYMRRVSEAVDHHAPNLRGFWQMVWADLLQHMDAPPTGGTFKGRLMPPLWVTIGGQRFAFTGVKLATNHYAIVARHRTKRGVEVARFTEGMSPEGIANQFQKLKAVGLTTAA